MQQAKTSGFSRMTVVDGNLPDAAVADDPEKHAAGTLPVKANDEYFSISLPEVPGGANSWMLPYLAPQRTTTLEIPYPVVESYSYTIWASANQELINKNTTIEKTNTLGAVSIHIEKRALNYYLITRSFSLRKSVIAPAEYDAFMELMRVWRNPNDRIVMFK
jgi:hypothetical protein